MTSIKRYRPRAGSAKVKAHKYNVNYTLINDDKRVIPVCKKFFMYVTFMKQKRL